eukprot:1220070-Alexandrium_andersonii.AAC.1
MAAWSWRFSPDKPAMAQTWPLTHVRLYLGARCRGSAKPARRLRVSRKMPRSASIDCRAVPKGEQLR